MVYSFVSGSVSSPSINSSQIESFTDEENDVAEEVASAGASAFYVLNLHVHFVWQVLHMQVFSMT